MSENRPLSVKTRTAPFTAWSPNIHYAQFQTLPPCRFPVRRLYDFELLYVCHGEMVTTMNGQRYLLSAGQLIFLPCGVYHQNEIVSAPEAKLMGIHFDFFSDVTIQKEEDLLVPEEEMVWDKLAAEAVTGTDRGLAFSADPIYSPSVECVQAMEQLIHEFARRSLGYELVCKGLMLEILAQLLRSQMARRIAGVSEHGERIKRLAERIDAAPAEDWSGRRIAAELQMSVDHAAKLFRQIIGVPPGEFLRTVRHREACRLLRDTDWTIEEVGVQVGYSDIHYFSRLFNANEGISPRAYRKLSRIL
ncbi:AraC family transcriptional regulator [Paenibacillus sp. FSL R5-0527]|uniref:helix-turn-helix transcriptional regulator n=1 Tax=Paenibacillus TaxID=44249 RepID=UPI000979D15D|nr:AraC family transcriptional regulator [Paenibacillus macerans]MED4955043.1 AraC family transcriptional regulator [Paenibacillus macerans]OMG50641.1 AraC family transcriptional regulator [Paenibacillus macerans]